MFLLLIPPLQMAALIKHDWKHTKNMSLQTHSILPKKQSYKIHQMNKCQDILSSFTCIFGFFWTFVCGRFRCRAVCVRRFRLRSVSSRPYGSFSCRFCGFQEGAFSMASYRSFRGSKGTLGRTLLRALVFGTLFLPHFGVQRQSLCSKETMLKPCFG